MTYKLASFSIKQGSSSEALERHLVLYAKRLNRKHGIPQDRFPQLDNLAGGRSTDMQKTETHQSQWPTCCPNSEHPQQSPRSGVISRVSSLLSTTYHMSGVLLTTSFWASFFL